MEQSPIMDAKATEALAPPGLVGNTADDDGRALDEYFEAAPSGPLDYAGIQHAREELPTTTRILSRAFVLTQGQQATLALPADPSRIKLVIDVMDVGPAYVSDANDIGTLTPYITTANSPLDLGAHTGPVWIAAQDAGTCRVHVWAVTT
jgi:hypothetical protein